MGGTKKTKEEQEGRGHDDDKLFKENLAEWLYEEKKLVTYQFLSISLHVNVNIAKQMLYEFYNDEAKKSKNKNLELSAVYYVSGTKRRFETACDEVFKYTATLCSEEKLDEVKRTFLALHSVHIYSLQLKNCDLAEGLSRAALELLNGIDGRFSAVEFGPYQLIEPKQPSASDSSQDQKKINAEASSGYGKSVSVSSGKEKSKLLEAKPEVNNNSKKQSVKSNEDDRIRKSSTVPSKEKEVSKNGVKKPSPSKDRLKNMFAVASAKPKTTKEPEPDVQEITESSESEDEDLSKSKQHAKKPLVTKASKSIRAKTYSRKKVPTRKAKEEPPKKRKKDIFSSSSEDESEGSVKGRTSSSDSGESPIPRKRKPRVLIPDSDDDDDFIESQPAAKGKLNFGRVDKQAETDLPPCKSGRRRITKTQDVTYEKDGYLVTERKQLLVSESESDGDGKDEKPDISKVDNVSTNENVCPIKPKEAHKSTEKQPTNSAKKTSTNAPPKTKQASLMSFFQKK